MKIYVAGPITIGNSMDHVHKAVKLYDIILEAGMYPFCPHLSVLWEMVSGKKPAETWYKYDNEWLKVCDALIRMPGKSKGADAEVEFARKNNILVVELPEKYNKYIVQMVLKGMKHGFNNGNSTGRKEL